MLSCSDMFDLPCWLFSGVEGAKANESKLMATLKLLGDLGKDVVEGLAVVGLRTVVLLGEGADQVVGEKYHSNSTIDRAFGLVNMVVVY